ncbi:MAG: hypothetical protein JWQ67_1730, partial [Marmoricola sp.]|nr:hypothetical protein [Marmoricola sp.]
MTVRRGWTPGVNHLDFDTRVRFIAARRCRSARSLSFLVRAAA